MEKINLTEILEETRDWCDDDDIEMDEVIGWTNRCLEKLAGEFGGEFQAETNLDPAQKEYSWDAGFLEINRVELLDDAGNLVRVLKMIPFDDAGNDVGNRDDITSYYELGRTIGIYPYPVAGTTGKIKTYGTRSFGQVTDGNSVPEFGPHIYHDAIVYYCCMRYYKREEENDEFRLYKDLFDERLQQRRFEVDMSGSGSGGGFQVKAKW